MTSSGSSVVRRVAIDEGDPLPPEDRLTCDEVRAEMRSFYVDHSTKLIGRLARHTGCRETARELAHEAFARFFGLPHVQAVQIERPRHYLKRIATNLLRERGRAQAYEQAAADHLRIEGGGAIDQVRVLEARDTLRRLEAALSKMKPRTREIFLAHRLDGMSYAEIANRTGISISAVEKHMMKAIAKIDNFLERA